MCDIWDPTCLIGSAVGAVTSKVTNSFLDELRHSAADMVTTALKTLGTFWLNIPSPQLGDGSAQNAGVATSLQDNLGFFTLLAAVVGLVLCGARIGLTAKSDAAADGVKMLARLIGVTAAGGAVVALLISAGDAFAPWVIEQSTGTTFAQSAPSLVTNGALLQLTPLLTIVSAIFAVLGAAAMVVYMIIRGGLLVVLMAVWPLAASMSATEQGLQWYRKVNAWMVAFVLLKPVAAIIYAAGFLLLRGAGTFTGGGDADTTALMSTLTGTAVLALAGLSLPALLRFVSPMTAAGSGAISGVAIGAAVVAAGAAVVSGGAAVVSGGAAVVSGGAAAASGGAAAGGAGAGAAGGGALGAFSAAGGGAGGGGSAGGGSGGGATDPSGGAGGGAGDGGAATDPGAADTGSSGGAAPGTPGGAGAGPAGGGSGSSGSRWLRPSPGVTAPGSNLDQALTGSIDPSESTAPAGASTTQSRS